MAPSASDSGDPFNEQQLAKLTRAAYCVAAALERRDSSAALAFSVAHRNTSALRLQVHKLIAALPTPDDPGFSPAAQAALQTAKAALESRDDSQLFCSVLEAVFARLDQERSSHATTQATIVGRRRITASSTADHSSNSNAPCPVAVVSTTMEAVSLLPALDVAGNKDVTPTVLFMVSKQSAAAAQTTNPDKAWLRVPEKLMAEIVHQCDLTPSFWLDMYSYRVYGGPRETESSAAALPFRRTRLGTTRNGTRLVLHAFDAPDTNFGELLRSEVDHVPPETRRIGFHIVVAVEFRPSAASRAAPIVTLTPLTFDFVPCTRAERNAAVLAIKEFVESEHSTNCAAMVTLGATDLGAADQREVRRGLASFQSALKMHYNVRETMLRVVRRGVVLLYFLDCAKSMDDKQYVDQAAKEHLRLPVGSTVRMFHNVDLQQAPWLQSSVVAPRRSVERSVRPGQLAADVPAVRSCVERQSKPVPSASTTAAAALASIAEGGAASATGADAQLAAVSVATEKVAKRTLPAAAVRLGECDVAPTSAADAQRKSATAAAGKKRVSAPLQGRVRVKRRRFAQELPQSGPVAPPNIVDS